MNLASCDICPKNCHVNRLANEKGVCLTTGENVFLARAALHFYEEPCISGKEGSGTVFFSGCNLHCVFCQNAHISNCEIGKEVTIERLAQIYQELADKGANNINLVTPTHYAKQIKDSILLARKHDFKLPFVYNTSGYEKVDTLREMEEVLDVYLTDFKYMDGTLAGELSHAKDYPEVAMDALAEMVRQKGSLKLDEKGHAVSGVIVRILLLPGHVKDGKNIVKTLYEAFGNQIWFSLMNQYTPMKKFEKYPTLNRIVTDREYSRFIDYALDLGIEQAFIQEGETQKDSFIPAFDYEGI